MIFELWATQLKTITCTVCGHVIPYKHGDRNDLLEIKQADLCEHIQAGQGVDLSATYEINGSLSV